ncbi:Uncharacterised protein [Bordetella pertussis]|nr:Uncharacterised protein [Bordetella pertussis]CFW06127.1 Uncharacterised protein [Bordetella pertussis]CFW39665.1 Uncharacterised protein [Bordetella pertussis]
MHHALPVRWWVAWRTRYMTGSRRLMLGEAMSIRARSTRLPSGCLPSRISRRRSSDSSAGRSRHGESVPGSVSVPRLARISSALCSST